MPLQSYRKTSMSTLRQRLRPFALLWVILPWLCLGGFMPTVYAGPVSRLCEVKAPDDENLYIAIYGVEKEEAKKLREELQELLNKCGQNNTLSRQFRKNWEAGGYKFKTVHGTPTETLYWKDNKDGSEDRQKALQDLAVQFLTVEIGNISSEARLKSLVGKTKKALILSVNVVDDQLIKQQVMEYIVQSIRADIHRKKHKPSESPTLEIELAAERTYLSKTVEKVNLRPGDSLLVGLEQVLLAVIAPKAPAPSAGSTPGSVSSGSPTTTGGPGTRTASAGERCPVTAAADCRQQQDQLLKEQNENKVLQSKNDELTSKNNQLTSKNDQLNKELDKLKATDGRVASLSAYRWRWGMAGVLWAGTAAGILTGAILAGYNWKSDTGIRQLPWECGEFKNMSCGAIDGQYIQGFFVAVGLTVPLAAGAIGLTVTQASSSTKEAQK